MLGGDERRERHHQTLDRLQPGMREPRRIHNVM